MQGWELVGGRKGASAGWVKAMAVGYHAMYCCRADLDGEVPSSEALAGVSVVPPGSAGGGSTVGSVPSGVAGGETGGPGPSWDELGLGTSTILAGTAADKAASGATGPTRSGAGVFLGEGLPTIPLKLAERIRKWEFVEMFELLPELLVDLKTEESRDSQPSRGRSRKRVQDINVWLQCFAVFVGVVAKSAPDAVPGMMGYMTRIIKASQEYDGTAWVAYDTAFRRQAAATGLKDWGKIDSSLYTVCFTGKARRVQRCDVCLSAAHRTSDCVALGEEDQDMAGRFKAVESALLALSSPQRGMLARTSRSQELCRLFNEKRCNFRNCKYRHACRWCGGHHAGCDCSTRGPGPIRSEGPRRPTAGPY